MHNAGAAGACAVARQGRFRAAASRLAAMEAAGAIRRRITSSHRYRSGDDDERRAVDERARGAAAALLGLVDDMKGHGRLEVVDMEGWSPDLAVLCGRMLEHAGYTVPGSKGQTCRHRGIGSYDWLHIAFARDAGVTVICTTDAAFADIAGNDDEFGHIGIQLTSTGAVGPLYDLAWGQGGA